MTTNIAKTIEHTKNSKTWPLIKLYFIAVTISAVCLFIVAFGLMLMALAAQGVYMTTGNCWGFILVCK